jgi:AcrR family transcriptional regulator
MRVKSEEKRREIVTKAWELFKESGFDRTTMSQISERVGGSKATLYGYYASKEQLFAAALEQVIRDPADAVLAHLARPGKLKTRLLSFAHALMAARLSEDLIAVEQALITEARRSELGELLRARFVQPQWRRLAAALDREMVAGHLRKADPLLATWHFRGLVEADLVERRLHGENTITGHEIKTAVEAGVDAFLRAYAPGPRG